MVAATFPTNPTNGQIATVAGRQYVYNSTYGTWKNNPQAYPLVDTYATPDDLPLSDNTSGDQAFVSLTNRLYIWTGAGWYNIALINTSPSITGGYESSYVFETDGTPIEITLVGNDPEGIPLTWSYEVTSGSLTNGGGTTATVSNVDNVFTITPSTNLDYAGSFRLTFKASDGVNLGTAGSIFTLSFGIQNSNYTTLLAKGIDAKQNSTFVDSSTNNHTITGNGDVYQGTFSPYRTGGYSMYFNGSSDYIDATPVLSSYTNTNDHFTVEFWMYPASTPSEYKALFAINDTSSYTNVFELGISGTNIQVIIDDAQSSISPFSLTTWTHLTAVFNGSSVKVYKNGQIISNQVVSNFNYAFSSCVLSIGQEYDSGATKGNYYNGYIYDIRMVKSSYVYTDNFAPPTESLEAITDTSLLINTPYIADSSTNSHAITVGGNTSIQPFTPFDYVKYTAIANGGSAYFDGSGDYLIMPAIIPDTQGVDFTVEFWFYQTVAAKAGLVGQYIVDAAGRTLIYIENSLIRFFQGATIRYSHPMDINIWYHVAMSRVGTTFYALVNGKLVSTWTSTTDITNTNFIIGQYNLDNFYTGYISDVCITTGSAKYTTDYNVPFNPVITDANTELKLDFTNAGIQDYSQVSDLKLIGNTTGSNIQTKNAPYSMYFDGSGDYIRADDAFANFSSTTEKFTIEAWIQPTASWTTVIRWLGINSKAAGSNIILIGMETIFGNWSASFNTPMTINTWNHFAFTYDGSVGTIYINGIQDISATFAISVNFSDCVLGIGAEFDAADGGSAGDYFTGYIEDLRITKGLVRYTANFTPPTTELLG